MNPLSQDQEHNVARFYLEEGWSGHLIAEHMEVSPSHIYRTLERQGVKREPRQRHARKRKRLTNSQVSDVLDAWDRGEPLNYIARTKKITPYMVKRTLLDNGFEPVARKAEGSLHHHWKGGKHDHEGYLKVKVTIQEAIRYKTTYPYVLEHRFRMALSLGRPLRDDETVHHLDGNKQNNDLKNLQLRSTHHGPGQRWRCAICNSLDVVPVEV